MHSLSNLLVPETSRMRKFPLYIIRFINLLYNNNTYVYTVIQFFSIFPLVLWIKYFFLLVIVTKLL